MTGGGSEAAAGTTAIDVRDLRKAYAGRPVLRGVSFAVGRGELFALLGPNGAGKTTTVEMIEGYRRADSGSIRVLGADPARADREHRARVGLMLQGGGGIDPRLTPQEAVGLYARFHARPRDVDEVLGAVGLSGPATRTRYRRLSGGERQRVGLALALVGRPEVAVLDEPTAGLDAEGRALIRDLLAALRRDGTAILLTSHDLADVERVADRIAILDRGRIIASGNAEELTPAGSPVLRFRLATPLAQSDRVALTARLAPSDAGAVVIEEDGRPGRYRIDGAAATPDLVAVVAAWCAERGAQILELRTGGATLEERYLELIAASGEADDGPEEARRASASAAESDR